MSDAFYRGRQYREHVVGQDGIRDTQFPCDSFSLVPYGSGEGRCEGDGHYMCNECAEHQKEEDEEGKL